MSFVAFLFSFAPLAGSILALLGGSPDFSQLRLSDKPSAGQEFIDLVLECREIELTMAILAVERGAKCAVDRPNLATASRTWRPLYVLVETIGGPYLVVLGTVFGCCLLQSFPDAFQRVGKAVKPFPQVELVRRLLAFHVFDVPSVQLYTK